MSIYSKLYVRTIQKMMFNDNFLTKWFDFIIGKINLFENKKEENLFAQINFDIVQNDEPKKVSDLRSSINSLKSKPLFDRVS